MNVEKYLLKSNVADIYKNCTDEKIKLEICKNYEKLLDENISTDKSVFSHRTYSIYPSIATYTALQNAGYTKDKAEKELESVILATGQGMKDTFAKLGKLKFFFPLFKKMCFMSTKTSYKKPYFDMRWTDHGKDKIAWECHQCHYHDEFAKYHFPELTKIFCRLDDVMYGSIPMTTWARTKTIGDGDALCDFCFIKNNN